MTNEDHHPHSEPAKDTLVEGSSDREELRALLAEVYLLALRLRQPRGLHPRDGIPFAGRNILRILQDTERTVPQIARVRSTTRQNIQVLVDRLADAGWVTLVPNPAHRRSKLVKLTDHARSALPRLLQDETALLTDLLPTLDRAEVRTTLVVLKRIEAALAPASAQTTITHRWTIETERNLRCVRSPGGALNNPSATRLNLNRERRFRRAVQISR